MEAATALALASPSTPLANQVAGHDGVMADASGSLVIKECIVLFMPALAREIAFYQLLNGSSRSQPIHRLKAFLPRFFGTLRLEGRMQPNGVLKEDIPEKGEVPESIVIENLSHGFTRPNILDVKLGTVLHEPSASDEKKARMEKQAKETTTREHGIRLTGFQTWHAPSSSYIVTPKSFGKSIKADQLPVGMQRFFPLPGDVLDNLAPVPSGLPATPITASNASATFDTIRETQESPNNLLSPPPTAAGADLGPGSSGLASAASSLGAPPPVLLAPAPNSTSSSTHKATSASTFTNHATPPKLLLRALELIDTQLEALEAALETLEIRFVGGSVLVVYEADPERLAESIERWDARVPKFVSDQRVGEGGADIGDRLGDDDDDMSGLFSDDDDDDDDDDDVDDDNASDDGRKEDERLRRKTPPVRVKMIDFAHTWLAQGEGPDQGVLLGLRTLRGLIRGRKGEVGQAMRGEV